ncbi:MAG: D-tyrosyl-tRNA(Tyr) deacylase [Gammaproteobacteria bacterium]|nr:D-tyrosyl-tRNA(Tyr) deacylase [Gammaproteobacteria bacterium]
MIALLQRVSQARVEIAGNAVAGIDRGLLVLVGVEREDDRRKAERLLERLLGYRVFPDSDGRMNISLAQMGGGLLLVPQFTLAADTRKGTRPGFSSAAAPQQGEQLFDYLLAYAASRHTPVAGGVFGANMQVVLTNDGPVTFWLQV